MFAISLNQVGMVKPCRTGYVKASVFAAFAEKARTMESVLLIKSFEVIIERNMGGSVSSSGRFSCEGKLCRELDAEKR